MSYNTTGKCHFDGIANEKELCERMQNDRSLAEVITGCTLIGDYTVEHIGGTKHKEDVILHTPNGSVKISAKFKKDKKKGSFDYLNGSAAYKKYTRGHLAAACGKFCSSPLPVETVRPFIAEASLKDLEEITPTRQIRFMLTILLIHPSVAIFTDNRRSLLSHPVAAQKAPVKFFSTEKILAFDCA